MVKKETFMANKPDDTASNPQADAHLPVSGEFDSTKINTSDALTNPDQDEENPANTNDVNKISAQNTGQTQDAPIPAGPANSVDIGNPGNDSVASADNQGMTNPS
jgi:hypothetical protein